MNVSEFCQRDVVTAGPGDSLIEAANLMRERHVGSVVVVDDPGSARVRPIGMLTDRDIVVAVVARDHGHLPQLTVDEVMTSDPITVRGTDAIQVAIERMRAYGVRRAPVLDEEGWLTGVVAIDDIVAYASDLLVGVSELMRRGRMREEFRRT